VTFNPIMLIDLSAHVLLCRQTCTETLLTYTVKFCTPIKESVRSFYSRAAWVMTSNQFAETAFISQLLVAKFNSYNMHEKVTSVLKTSCLLISKRWAWNMCTKLDWL